MLAKTTLKRATSAFAGAVVAMMFAAPALADSPSGGIHPNIGNPNTIDWTIKQYFPGSSHGPVPLRNGQHDYGRTTDHADGFGWYHIVDGHGFVDPADIASSIANGEECVNSPTLYRVNCDNGYTFVVYDWHHDPYNKHDSQMTGVITAWYHIPGCKATLTAVTPKCP